MERIVLDHITPVLETEALFRALKMSPQPGEEDTELLLRMREEALAVARPKAVYTIVPITEKGEDFVTAGGVKLVSPLVRENLERVSRIVPFVATCGTELEEWAKGYSDPLEGYFADAVMLQFLGQANRALREAVRREWFRESDMSCMSPGSLSAWPLPEQANLFELVGGVTEAIGVRLTPSYLMLPSKSTSGFFFSSETHYENCRYCPIISCPNRRAEFCGERR